MKNPFKIIDYYGWKLFWKLARAWFTGQFNDVKSAVASVDLTSVTNAIGQAKEEIIAAVEGIDPYVELSNEELDSIVNDEESEEESTSEPSRLLAAPEEPQEENRPRIEAYNANLDVRVNLRRTNVDSGMATWEDEEQNVWYTDYPYALGDAVWNSNPATSQAWGVISLISE